MIYFDAKFTTTTKKWFSTLRLNYHDVLTRQTQLTNIFKSGHPYCTSNENFFAIFNLFFILFFLT